MRVFLFVFCLAILAMGCKKDLQDPTNKKAANSALFAKWELRIARGYLQPDVNFAAGNGDIVQFNADSTYVFYQNNTITQQGTFHIAPQAFAQGPEKLDLIYYDNSTDGQVIWLQNDALTLGNSAADGPSYVYAKK